MAMEENIGVNETAPASAESAADLGKFKSVDALLEAYNSLQAEFTRRSQRLKELEKTDNSLGLARAETEKPVSPVPAPELSAQKPSLSEDELYDAVSNREAVRLKIVGDYLASLKNVDAPVTYGGVGTLAAPPSKAKSIAEAGNMALRYFKKEQA